jgi:hypothetical protein
MGVSAGVSRLILFCTPIRMKRRNLSNNFLRLKRSLKPQLFELETNGIYKISRDRSVRETSHKVNVNESTWVNE